MHFEFLVEGQTELTALSMLTEKILGNYGETHTWKIHKHRGIGKLPEDLAAKPNRKDPTLLHNLPSKLRAYSEEEEQNFVVIVLLDLDDRPSKSVFLNELSSIISFCKPELNADFILAIEELEAWFLGDQNAILSAYPNAKQVILDSYIQDSQCGTWEVLADALHPGGVKALHRSYGKRSARILEMKRMWAKNICQHMVVSRNRSPSFAYFVDKLESY